MVLLHLKVKLYLRGVMGKVPFQAYWLFLCLIPAIGYRRRSIVDHAKYLKKCWANKLEFFELFLLLKWH